MNGYAQLFREVVEHPHVVVAGKKSYVNAGITQFGQFSLKSNKALGNGMAVFKPKVEDVTQQIDGRSIMTNLFEPGYNFTFPLLTRVMRRDAKMKIRSEVYLFAGGELNRSRFHGRDNGRKDTDLRGNQVRACRMSGGPGKFGWCAVWVAGLCMNSARVLQKKSIRRDAF